MRRLWAHPLAVPGLWLAAGVLAAAVLSTILPTAESAGFSLPGPLAARLSESGDERVVLGRPHVLWIVPLAVGPFLVAMARRSLVDAPWWQVGLQVLLRAAVLMALALALALPTLRAPVRGKTVVFVVDVSESIDEGQLAGASALVREALATAAAEDAAGVPREDRTRVRLVAYAQGARAVDLDDELPGEWTVPRDPGSALASDHAGGLRLAQALVDPDTQARIVLVTDGTGSLAEREGLAIAASELERRGIALHTRTFPSGERGDVLVESVGLPGELRVGQSFEVAVDVVSTAPMELTLHLERDGRPNPLAPSQVVGLRGGRQQIKMPARVTEPGPVVFTARLDTSALPSSGNRSRGNDAAAAVGDVRGRPRVLHVGSDPTGALARALGADHLAVQTLAPDQLPDSAEGLRGVDLVVFSDVPRRQVSPASQKAIARWVEDLGGGFVMIGGEASFGLGGWGGSTIESILPVGFEGERQREQPTLALVLVIDKSGSMSSDDKLDLVKEAARATARALDPSDEIGVVAFDSRPQVLVRLQRASNRLRISSDIRRLNAGGGTNALPALRESYLQLAGSKALVKHVILLSDGQSPTGGIESLVRDMRDADVTVSAVGVGDGAGKDLLARIAELGRGRYYFSSDGTDVPRIFSRETREVTRNAVVERALYPRVAKSVQALRGIDFARAPGLRGIVPVEPKPQAEVLLRTHLGDPLLVRGRRGLGRTIAFASDAQPRWAAAWLTWNGFPKLWSQIARDTMRQGAALLGGSTLEVHPGAEIGTFRVVVDVESGGDGSEFADDLEGHVEVVDPALPSDDPGRVREVELALTAPGRYEATLRDIVTGQRLLRARLYDPGQTPRRLASEALGQVSVPYPAELAPEQLTPDPAALASLGDGTHDGPIGEVVAAPGESRGRTRTRTLWPNVLWGLLLPLMAVDLLLRRISLGVRRVDT
jgi:Mg-chelatase subunit ChlD